MPLFFPRLAKYGKECQDSLAQESRDIPYLAFDLSRCFSSVSYNVHTYLTECSARLILFCSNHPVYNNIDEDDDDDYDDDDDNNNNNNNNNRIYRCKSRFFFYNLLIAPRTVSNTYAHVARAQSCAKHVQHIERLSRATCRVTCHVVRRDSSAIKFDIF